MSLFYLCTELNCNRKYKTKDKLVNHLLDVHSVVVDNIPAPVAITKDNKKLVENRKDTLKKDELREKKIKEIQQLREIEESAKAEFNEKYKLEQIEILRQIEEEKINLEKVKLEQTNELLKLDQAWLHIRDKFQKNFEKNPNDCVICTTEKADTAVIPCGHKYFCYKCIDDYHKKEPRKGCPMCRQEIIMISKIFSSS